MVAACRIDGLPLAFLSPFSLSDGSKKEQTPVKVNLNTNFLNHFPVTVDMFSKT